MDGNSSGSMQSSSGDEDEYDSRAESSSSFSALFLNNPQQIGPFSTTSAGGEPPNSSSTHNLNNPLTQHHTPMFDPLSSYCLDLPIQRPISSTTKTATTSLIPNNHSLNLDMMWSSKLDRSEPNQSDLATLMQVRVAQIRGSAVGVDAAFPTTTQQHPLPPQAQINNNNNRVRNPKKRSRASRRAATTVLTTDTTNFRAMVQEFTGIPASPFTSSLPFQRTRLDLFGNSVSPHSASTSMRSNNLEPPYLLRPFAQKAHPFSSSSISIPSSSSTPISFPLVPNSSSSMVDDTLLANNNNSTIFSFNSILQAPQQKYPPSHLASKTPQTNSTNTIDSSLKVGVFEELGLMSHAHVGGALHHHQNMVHSSSDGALSRINNNKNSNCGDHGGEVIMRELISNIQDHVSNNGKVNNYNNSDFIHGGEKKAIPECGVAANARSEGMVESWINCSSSD